MSTGAGYHRGGSRQDYATPDDFMAAVRLRFGPLAFDLAADATNFKAEKYFTIEQDSLRQEWSTIPGTLWLNPPFAHIEPWAKKCACESVMGARILFLVPASVGSVWFARWVHRRAFVLALSPRLTFDGENPYPKDTILAGYGFGTGFDVWDWKTP